jgi:hypothetical protein
MDVFTMDLNAYVRGKRNSRVGKQKKYFQQGEDQDCVDFCLKESLKKKFFKKFGELNVQSTRNSQMVQTSV